MPPLHDVLRELLLLPGATYSCAAGRASGALLAEAGAESVDPAVVVRWAQSAAGFLADAGDDLDDLMITSRRSYRLVRPVDDDDLGPLLLLLCLDRGRANLAAARRELARVRIGAAPPVLPPALSPAPSLGPTPAPSVPERPAASAPGWMPLPRRVPSAIPPAAVWTPPTRAPRWPGPGRSGAPPAANGAPAVPRPRGPAPAAGPSTATAAPGAPSSSRWADDVGTMRRLLAGLRALR